MATTLSVRVRGHLVRAIETYLGHSMYLNKSDFLRDAVREKLEREAPELLHIQFRESSQKEEEVM